MNDMSSVGTAPIVRDLADGAQHVIVVPHGTPLPDLSTLPNFVASYPYFWKDGSLAVLIIRYNRRDGKHPGQLKKALFPLTLWQNFDGTLVWAKKGMGDERPLYGLPDLVMRGADPVILSEGEKCADAVRRAFPSYVSMTWMGGTNALSKTDFSPLSGRDVIIFPDHDDPGYAAAESLKQILTAVDAKRIRVLDIAAAGRLVSQEVTQGYDIADAIHDGLTEKSLGLLIADSPELHQSDNGDAPRDDLADPVMNYLRKSQNLTPDLPEGFSLSEAGVFKHGTGARGVPTEIFAGSPIAVAGRSRTGADGHGWGFCVTLQTPDKSWVSITLPNSLLAGDGKEMREILARHGFVCPQDRAGRQALGEYLSYSRATDFVEIASRPGWHGESFVLPQAVISAPGNARSVQLDMQDRPHFFAQAGSFDDWKRLAKLAENSSRAAFALCLALTAPLLRPLGESGGGAHLCGRSSRGKTTFARLAGSVWGGGGQDGFVRSWLATGNGIEGVAADHNDVLLALDELSMMPPELAADLYYMLANGHGKSRATKTGAAQASAQWHAMVLSTGEDTSAAHIRSGPKGAQRRVTGGVAVRMVDIPVECAPGRSFEDLAGFANEGALAEHIGHKACEIYGHAGPEFVRCLIADNEVHLANARHITADFVEAVTDGDDDSQIKRVAKRFGLIAAAGALATEFGILPWAPDAAFNAVATCYAAWKTNRGTGRSEEEREALRALREFFELHGASRFEPVTSDHAEDATMMSHQDRIIHDRCGYRTIDADGNAVYYVLPEAFRSQVCGGHNPEIVLAVARECGALMLGENGRAQKKVRLPEYPGGTRVYAFVMHKLST